MSRAEALARHLETEITSQALAPGHFIGTKSELRERFGVAVATMNEAVRLMESRGIVSARRGRGGGLFVATEADKTRAGGMLLGLDWSHATLRDCVEVRAALEPAIYRDAARHIGPGELAELDTYVDRMAEALDDDRAYRIANYAFHRQCAALCRNVPLRSVYLSVLDVLEAGLMQLDFDRRDAGSIDVHRDLVAAIGEGDAERLEAAIERHAKYSPLPL
jgi:DNA-binding FadR family transcriptional regulator